MKNYYPPLEPDSFYHIFNHAVGQDDLFKEDENYNFFLKKYSEYINPIADTFAYCLMPNHFHFLVRIKDEAKISDLTGIQKRTANFVKGQNIDKVVKYASKQFSNLFSSYTQSFNKQQNRKGTLFQRPFKRIKINNEKYLKNTIRYIHYNPVHHDFVENIEDWKHSSYNSFFTNKETKLKREEVIELFDDLENFQYFNNKEVDGDFFDDFE